MKKLLLVLVAFCAISLANSLPAAAQAPLAATVKIPFSFIAGGRVLPAGSYRIAPTTADWSVVTISSMDGKQPQAAIVQTIANTVAEPYRGEAQVKFMPYGGHRFLQEIAVPGRDARRVVITPALAERTLVKLNLSNAEVGDPAK